MQAEQLPESRVRGAVRARWRAALVLTGLLALPSLAGATPEAWVERFYGGGPFCSTAVVTQARVEAGTVYVSLDIDTRWARQLQTFEKPFRDRYFALHCPTPIELRFVRQRHGVQGVLVSAQLPGLGSYSYACEAG